jgi:hypothetical protein
MKPTMRSTMQASQATASEDNYSSTKPKSLGEELYLVHLRRVAGVTPDEEDFDRGTFTPRKRAHSLGEELWGVHLKRSRGLEGDLNEEIPTDSAPNKSSERAAEKNKRGKKAKKETSSDTSIQQTRYELRKRGGGKAKSQ